MRLPSLFILLAGLAASYPAHAQPADTLLTSESLFPYGFSEPVLTCAPLRVCLIELAEGERIVNPPIAGDNARWMIDYAYQGTRPLVLVKPTDHGITTNLIVTTDRRIYDLTLDSPPIESASSNLRRPFTRRVRFYYPGEMEAGELEATAPPPPACEPLPAPPVDTRDLSFGYVWTKDKPFPWVPEAVFDDGRRTYIKLPASAMASELPPLYSEGPAGREVVNFAPPEGGDRTFVADRVLERAVFVFSAKKGRVFKESTLTIIRRPQ